MEKLEHIGIAVRDLESANKLFASLLGRQHYKTEEVPTEGVMTSFFDVGGVKIELLQATREDSPIARFLEKRGEGVHHLAFEVSNIQKRLPEFAARGFQPMQTAPKKGADNKLICFLHPKTTQGVLIELCEEIKSPSSS